MTAVLPVTSGKGAFDSNGAAWRLHLVALGLAASGLLLLFRNDAAAMVRIWLESSTFAHCILIPPIIAWLVWQRLPELRELSPGVWPPALFVVAVGAILWLLGQAGGIGLVRHLALMVMLQGAVMTCLGKAVARGLAFPLFYAFFLVPAGEEIVPLMQTLTAKMCMILLGWVGIAAHIEGVFITTPAGAFEVAEACSGVKFLVAMVAYGVLAANLCFRSRLRRLLFVAAAVVIPILANGVRAWGTIYVASLTSADFAEGFDHVLYGWIFFAIVIALLMAAGWRFFDRSPNGPWLDPAVLQQGPGRSRPQNASLFAGAAILATAALPLGWSHWLEAAGVARIPDRFTLPQPAGWRPIPAVSGRQWTPHYAGADRLWTAHYRDRDGREVTLVIAVYARQEEGRELIGFGQGAVAPEGSWAWTANGRPPSGGRLDRITSFGTLREVATFYRVARELTGNPYEVKMATIKTRLLGGPQRAVAVLVSAQAPGTGVSPRPAIDSFLAALGPVDRLADRAAGGR